MQQQNTRGCRTRAAGGAGARQGAPGGGGAGAGQAAPPPHHRTVSFAGAADNWIHILMGKKKDSLLKQAHPHDSTPSIYRTEHANPFHFTVMRF